MADLPRPPRHSGHHRTGGLYIRRCYIGAGYRSCEDRFDLVSTWSGWRDLNPRPLAPKASADGVWPCVRGSPAGPILWLRTCIAAVVGGRCYTVATQPPGSRQTPKGTQTRSLAWDLRRNQISHGAAGAGLSSALSLRSSARRRVADLNFCRRSSGSYAGSSTLSGQWS
jgi:hypothetical protein